MADWKLPVSYNYNPSYHAYAYGLMYPQGPEQNHQNLGWAEAYNHQGVSGGYYTPPPPQQQQLQQQHQSPPRNLEDGHATNPHFPSSVLYFADSHSQNGRLFLSHNRTQTSQQPTEIERASSDTPSDSEAHTPGKLLLVAIVLLENYFTVAQCLICFSWRYSEGSVHGKLHAVA